MQRTIFKTKFMMSDAYFGESALARMRLEKKSTISFLIVILFIDMLMTNKIFPFLILPRIPCRYSNLDK